MVHNGMLNIHDLEDKVSDTWLFARYMKDMKEQWHQNPNTIKCLESFISDSKMVLMSPHTTIILNRKYGIEEDGIWYSNESYLNLGKRYRASQIGFEFNDTYTHLEDLYQEL